MSKKTLAIPNTIVKIFDSRTLDILPYSHRFLPNISSLSVVDESSCSFIVSDITGECSLYSLMNGLVETQRLTVSLYTSGN